MTVQQLLAWVVAAQDWYSKNFRSLKGSDSQVINKSLSETRPANANGIDFMLAELLMLDFEGLIHEWHNLYPK